MANRSGGSTSFGSPIPAEAWSVLRDALGWGAREMEVVRALFEDEDVSGVSARLGISRDQTDELVQAIYRKLNVSSRAQLVIRVFALYLVVVASEPRDLIGETAYGDFRASVCWSGRHRHTSGSPRSKS